VKEDDSEFIKHGACPNAECGSSDALAIYTDGHGYCFSCNSHYSNVSDNPSSIPVRDSAVDGRYVLLNGESVSLKSRGITQDTTTKFSYLVAKDKKKITVQVANYANSKGKVVAQKLRYPDKKFVWIGDTSDITLFGQNVWRSSGKMIVVTEGELDALSVSQCNGNKYPVVSLSHGAASARKQLSKQLEWLENFESVILMFDNDSAGLVAAEECASLFSPGKCKIAKLDGAKDANELLKHGEVAKIIDSIWGARPYRPDGIICGSELKESIDKPLEWGLSYPYEDLTKLTYGIRQGEIICLGAGTGMGKSEFYKEIATHIGLEHNKNVGLIFLEENVTDTALSIMSKHGNIPFHIPDAVYTQEQKDNSFNETLAKGNFFFHDHFGYMDYNSIKSKIRYMVVNCDCKYIFLDHITALVTGHEGDERRELDRIMADLATLVRELGFTLFIITHLATPEGKPHEEGGRVMLRHFRGSRAIGQWCNFCFGLERNQQAEEEALRHTTTLRILKDRYTGRSTGECVYLGYDSNTGRINSTKQPCPFDEQEENKHVDF